MTNRLTRRDLLLSSASLALLGVRGAGQPRATRSNPPNILVILADDMGYADLSIYGCRDYQTPVLDRLAREGLMMTSGHANSAVCSATRFAMITGRYQYRIPSGLFEPGNGGPDYGIPAGHPTLPSLMRLQGYRTSLFGKWHLGGAAQYLPTSKGHDYFFGFLGGATDYFRVGGGEGPGEGVATTRRRQAAGRRESDGVQVARTDPEDEDPELLVRSPVLGHLPVFESLHVEYEHVALRKFMSVCLFFSPSSSLARAGAGGSTAVSTATSAIVLSLILHLLSCVRPRREARPQRTDINTAAIGRRGESHATEP